MNSLSHRGARGQLWPLALLVVCLSLSFVCEAQNSGQPLKQELETSAREQILLLHQEKLSRTPAQRKIGSQLLYSLRQKRQGIAPGLKAFKPTLRSEPDGRILVDVHAIVSPALARFINANGGLVVNSFARDGAIRALIPVELAEVLALRGDVRFIRPAAQAVANTAVAYETGDIAHRAAEARQFFSTDGSGIKIGVLSDSIDNLTNAQANGALPFVTVLPGQAGTGFGEGTAILEIVHALAPGAALYFATGFGGEASFAQNIRNLQAAGCKIIIDDVTYFDESPFQDGPVSQAVNDVSAAGVLYFSSAGNSGGVDRGNSGTWEGDFKDAGPATVGQGGRLHDFGGATYNTMLAGIGFERLDLTWSDPLGHSSNDYDLYVVDSSGNVVASSTDNQSGTTDPYESLGQINVGQRIVIVKYAGEDRFLHLSSGRGHLAFATTGTTFGHNASGASNAFCVAAVRVGSPAVPFVGGPANPVEMFSSDGPRHIFFNPDGTPITPGDVSSTGGQILQKPDLTAADGVFTTVPGFAPFYGTSAAAPHAGAIAALLWSYNPLLTPGEIRSALTGTALQIGAPGFDRNSGFGIVMAYPALAVAPQAFLQSVQLQDANQNGQLDPNECADLVINLQNTTSQTLTGLTAVLTSTTPQVFVDPTPRSFPDLQSGESAVSTTSFHISTGPGFVCGSNAFFRLQVSSALGSLAQPFDLSSRLAGFGNTNSMVSTNVPIDVPDLGTIESGIQVSGLDLPLARVRVAAHITHSYDQDLRLSLIGPDNTEVLLSANNGQSGQNYGDSCDAMTYFSDDATVGISVASAPFVGEFAPDQPLSVFQGKSGAAVNGLWRLRVADEAAQDTGTLQCWSLELTPIGCFDGGGQCLSPPQLAQDISDIVVTNGDPVQFSAVANGTGPLLYQWFYNSTNALIGETNATLVLSNATLSQAGIYQLVVSNLYGTISSSSAALTIMSPPIILGDIIDLTVTNGDTVTFSILAQGNPALTYQWYFNSTNALLDQTNSALVLSNANTLLQGNYQVVITNTLGQVTSAAAKLRVLVVPTIACSPDVTVGLGTVWDFSGPSYQDTNLVVEVLGTVTNALCGESFSATRQWQISDTNGYQVTCSQTVQVLNTNPPLMSCSGDKTVVEGNGWSFDVPTARDAQAVEGRVYDNWSNDLQQALDPGAMEVGNQVSLEGTQRYPSRLALEYWATNAQQENLSGVVTAEVRFYQNDGPALSSGEATPGTVFYDSGPVLLSATNRGALVIEEFDLSAAVPLVGALPGSFTWTVRFGGLGSNDAAGLNWYGKPVVGSLSVGGYWALQTNGWALLGQADQGFGGQLTALSSGVSLSVVSTTTNAECARSLTATRTWQAQDACGNTNSCTQTVTVLDQSGPLVMSQTPDQTVQAGRTVKLGVNVASCPPVWYQWFFNQTNFLDQATNATLLLTNVGPDQSGSYIAVVTNNFGSTTSAPINLVVAPPPSISSNAVDQVATNGDNVVLSVVAEGTGPLSYQWFFDATSALIRATNATLIFSNVSPAQAGVYQVVVSDAVGSVTSAPVRLQVLVAPFLTNSQGAVRIPGAGSVDSPILISGLDLPLARVDVGFYLTYPQTSDLRISLVSPDGTEVMLIANNGDFAANYGASCNEMTWFSDAADSNILSAVAPFIGTFQPQQPLSAFIGKTDASLNGIWTLRVQNSGRGSGAIQCWSMNLVPMGCPIGGGECLTPPQIVQNISDQVITNGTTADWIIAVEGTQPLSYQWFYNVTNALLFATNATLELTNVGPELAGQYQVVATNLYGSATSALANLTVALPPSAITGPSDQLATNGDTVIFNVLVQGSSPLSFQWFFDNTNLIAQATNSTLVLSNVSPAQSGTYQILVTNPYGSVTSDPANLLVRLLPQVVCSPDVTVGLGTVWDFSGPSYEDTNLVVEVLGTVTNALCGESFSATRQWQISDTNGYQVTCSQTVQVLNTNPPLMSCSGDKTVVEGNGWSFDVPTARDAQAVEGRVYDNWSNDLQQALDPGAMEVGNQVSLEGTQRYPSRLALEYWATNAQQENLSGVMTAEVRFYQNDGPALSSGEATPGTVFYDSGPVLLSATNRGALVIEEFDLSAAVPLVGALPGSFTWTVRFGGLGSNDAAGLNWYGKPVVGSLSVGGYWALQTNGWALLGQADQGFGGQLTALSSGVSLSVVSTTTNAECARSLTATRTWQAQDACGNTNSCTQTVTVVDQSGPLVMSQTPDQTVQAGRTVKLGVNVASCPPVWYQWFFNQTNLIANATNSILVLTNIHSTQAGSYSVAVTNTYGSILCSPILVVVDVPAVIVGNPVDQVATNGDDVHWRVLAKGSAPLFYQWYFNLTNALPQQTNSTLDLPSVTASQAGVYQVIVSNVYGSVTSAPAFLTIVLPPTIVNAPGDQVVTNGDTLSWSVDAQGTSPLTYQWFFNNTLLGLATNSTLVFSNVSPAQAGVYEVVVANAYGSVTSAPANLQVVVVPQVVCSPNTTVSLGSPWDFAPPTFSDPTLSVQVVDTTTNSLCGNSFSATRQWLITDTNGAQATCTQTVRVLDTVTPMMNCPGDKIVLSGSNWSFDLPTAREAGANEVVVYDDFTNYLGQRFDPGLVEVGNQITLDGTYRYPTRLTLEYWGTNATQDSFTGSVAARVRFYHNDGPRSSVTAVTPGTLFYDSGLMPITATNQGSLTIEDFQLSAPVPLEGAIPSSFTWTIQFQGMEAGDAAGLNLYDSPLIGESAPGYWAFDNDAWTLQTQSAQAFGSQLAALNSGVSLSVLSTVTNTLCPQAITVTRTWQGLDSCSNSITCGQTVTIVDPSAPSVLNPPKDQSAILGQTVSFNVDVSSCPPISYQWYSNSTNALADATNATLVLPDVRLEQAGGYLVVVANAYGSVTSTPAILTVSGAPVILAQPIDILAALGGSALFNISVLADPAPSYQWLFNGTNLLVGETNSSLTLSNVQPVQAGLYSIVVTNSAGLVTSAGARLSLVGSPIITLQPQGVTNFQGQTVILSVEAIGAEPLNYQWMADRTKPISGATSPSLRLKSVGSSDSGSYCVIVSNDLGSVVSQPAVLRVLVEPKMTALTRTQNDVSLSFATISGLLYTVYFSDSLLATNWSLLPNVLQQPGSGAPMTVRDSTGAGANRFYRILVQ